MTQPSGQSSPMPKQDKTKTSNLGAAPPQLTEAQKAEALKKTAPQKDSPRALNSKS